MFPRHVTSVPLVLLCLVALAIDARAQTARLALTHLGLTIAAVGDLDGDGRGDLAVSELQPFPVAARVRVMSGADGSVLLAILVDLEQPTPGNVLELA